ncbi:MAG: hypothetical protein E6121_04750, partial [Varibaculum cambriense]|nr:hypothetical protein [Varibaculum cambriense]
MTSLIIGDWKIPESGQELTREGWGVLDGATVSFGRQNQLDNPEIGTMRAVIRCETLQAARRAHSIHPGTPVKLDSTYKLSHAVPKTVAIKDGWITPYLTPTGHPTGWAEWSGNYYLAGSCWVGPGPWNTGNPQEWRYLSEKVNAESVIAVELTLTAPQYAPAAPKARLTGATTPSAVGLTITRSDPEIKAENTAAATWKIKAEAPIPVDGYPALCIHAPAVCWDNYPQAETWETISNPSWRIWGTWKVEKTLKLGATSKASQRIHVFSGVITTVEIKGLPAGKSEITLTASDHLHPLNAAKIAAPRRPAEPLLDRIKWALNQTEDYLTKAGYT